MNGSAPLVLALNVGSSSLKFGLYRRATAERVQLCLGGTIDPSEARHSVRLSDGTRWHAPGSGAPLRSLLRLISEHGWPQPVAVGHRIVHGGPHLQRHVRIDDQVLAQLEAACAFAPLHVPPALALVRQVTETLPGTCQVACLDTAFHADMPLSAKRLPLPQHWHDQGIRRFGFHGLSCESIVQQLGAAVPNRLVIAHLGSGASVTAVREGRSIGNSMGLTPDGGLIMATRSGDLDPGLLCYLLREQGLKADALEQMLEHESGLFGLSGRSGDMRELRTHPDAQARLALEMFAQAVARQVAAAAVDLGGLDRLVLTGGIGEHDEAVRTDIGHLLRPLFTTLDLQVMAVDENERIGAHTLRML